MRIYLFPYYVRLPSARVQSPQLFGLLSDLGVHLEVCYTWHGTLESLPKEPGIIMASTQMTCPWNELGKKCKEMGHFCFYDDKVVRENGVLSDRDFIDEVKKFLKDQEARSSASHNGEEIDLPPFSPSLIDVGGI